MYTALIVLLFACSAYGKPYDINAYVDKFLLQYNEANREAGLGIVPIPDASLGPISYQNSYKVGLDSLYRIGECTAENKEKEQSLKCLLGFSLLVFVNGKLTIDGSLMTATTRVGKNSFQFDFTVQTQDNCKVTLEKYEFVDFGDLSFSSSLPEFDKEPIPEDVAESLKQHLNSVLSSDEKKNAVEQSLQKFFCNK